MKIDLAEFRKREKYISEKKHDTLDLIVWNYKNSCQFDNAWDEYTIMARGLITDLEGNVVARPFKKFFNINTFEGTKIEELPAEIPEITEKLDGSLGILYPDNENYAISTRGSFNSEQAIFATKLIKEKKYDFKKGFTYLFEIIYPENKIVVDYGNRKELVLLAVINTETGEEINFIEEAKRLEFSYAEKMGNDLNDLLISLDLLSANNEGFVVKYSNNFRVKMKGKEYIRLHKLISGFSNTAIWELLMNEQPFDEFLDRVPDEFYQWIKTTKKELENIKKLPTRKEQALEIIKNYKDISSAIFNLLDSKKEKAKKELWKMLKPKFSKPFKNDIEL
jgi:RNA ligase